MRVRGSQAERFPKLRFGFLEPARLSERGSGLAVHVPVAIQGHRLPVVEDGRLVVAGEFVDPAQIAGQPGALHPDVQGLHRVEGGVVGDAGPAHVFRAERDVNPEVGDREVGDGRLKRGRQFLEQGLGVVLPPGFHVEVDEVEPILRHQRGRHHGAERLEPGDRRPDRVFHLPAEAVVRDHPLQRLGPLQRAARQVERPLVSRQGLIKPPHNEIEGRESTRQFRSDRFDDDRPLEVFPGRILRPATSLEPGQGHVARVIFREPFHVSRERLPRLVLFPEFELSVGDLPEKRVLGGAHAVQPLQRPDQPLEVAAQQLNEAVVAERVWIFRMKFDPHFDDSPRLLRLLREEVVVRFHGEVEAFRKPVQVVDRRLDRGRGLCGTVAGQQYDGELVLSQRERRIEFGRGAHFLERGPQVRRLNECRRRATSVGFPCGVGRGQPLTRGQVFNAVPIRNAETLGERDGHLVDERQDIQPLRAPSR